MILNYRNAAVVEDTIRDLNKIKIFRMLKFGVKCDYSKATHNKEGHTKRRDTQQGGTQNKEGHTIRRDTQ